LADITTKVRNLPGPIFVEVRIKTGARKDLGRPQTTTTENKLKFMEFLEQ
jgi:phosphonopyruvate decarboxylase